MRTLTSDEVNFLIFRYLNESGFKHSAFTFGYESQIHKSTINYSAEVPPGALISFLQKGIQYMEIETKMKTKDAELKYNSPLELLVPSLKNKITQSKGGAAAKGAAAKRKTAASKAGAANSARDTDDDTAENDDDEEMEDVAQKDSGKSGKKSAKKQTAAGAASAGGRKGAATANGAASAAAGSGAAGAVGATLEEGIVRKQEEPIEIHPERVTTLRGHTHEVFICAWSPTNPTVLASGSGDSTARIWTLPPGQCGKYATEVATQSPIVLHHSQDSLQIAGSKDVTTLDWSGDGEMLATGSYDGKARIWTKDGQLKSILDQHKGPIFSLKWNKRGDYLLSGSVDNSAIVWDVKSGKVQQKFNYHVKPTLDVDWRTDTCFATCSTDKMIYVCQLGEQRPVRQFEGHEDEVNAIRWDPSGNLLASCSDDFTAKIWSMKSDKYIHDFREHTKEIYTIKWSPTGPGTAHPNKDLVLASASFDATIKIWDVNVGKCIHNLTKHTDPVYSVAFSPNGDYLASGSFDRCLHIWSVKDGSLIKTYRGNGSIFEVCWNATGDKVAACFSNSIIEDFSLCVVDFDIRK